MLSGESARDALSTQYFDLSIVFGVVMAKENREMAWMQCTECNDLNYRTEIKVAGGAPKFERKRYCPRERRHTVHKIKRK